MPIAFHGESQSFHLYNDSISMILRLHVMEDQMTTLLMPYFGARVSDMCAAALRVDDYPLASFDGAAATLPFACPTGGQGDFRPTQITAIGKAGHHCTKLAYICHEIIPGKRKLEGLPATYVEDETEATTLRIVLQDVLTQLTVALDYTMFEHTGAVAISTHIENKGNDPLVLTELRSAALSLKGSYDLLHLHGAWGKERSVERVMPMHGERTIRSKRGASGHQHNPFAALPMRDTTEFAGNVYGVSLVYSGNFCITVDEDAYGQTRLVAGLDDQTIRWTLDVGEHFQTPEAIVVFSGHGLNGMSQIFHALYRTRLCRGKYRDAVRPILMNNWEATYFDFTQERILEIARTAAEIGVELFILDDGWFGARNSDDCALGDWSENEEKLPQGIEGLSREIHALGMQFGLWFEPEMVSEESGLYRAHPDWCLHVPGRYKTPARNQLILDLSRGDVQDYVVDSMSDVLTRGKIDYVKWDMNRNFAEIGSALLTAAQQSELPHRYMLGVYNVMERLTHRHAEVLFEGCSGGGGRFDPGMLYYMPQIWTSDNTDAVERLRIQYGTSMVYPASSMGAHVSAVPNHQVQRITSIAMRAHVAMGGIFGHELDLTLLTNEECVQVKTQIEFVKATRHIVMYGKFTRLISPFEENWCAWQFEYEGEILLFVFQVLQTVAGLERRVCLRDIGSGTYCDMASGRRYTDADLTNCGIEIDFRYNAGKVQGGDFQSRALHLRREG